MGWRIRTRVCRAFIFQCILWQYRWKWPLYFTQNFKELNNELNTKQKEILELVKKNKINIEGENIVTNSRHQYLINQSLNSLEKALETVNSGLPLDIIAIDVRDILMNLGKITGKNVSEDVINEIFSKFCLGK